MVLKVEPTRNSFLGKRRSSFRNVAQYASLFKRCASLEPVSMHWDCIPGQRCCFEPEVRITPAELYWVTGIRCWPSKCRPPGVRRIFTSMPVLLLGAHLVPDHVSSQILGIAGRSRPGVSDQETRVADELRWSRPDGGWRGPRTSGGHPRSHVPIKAKGYKTARIPKGSE